MPYKIMCHAHEEPSWTPSDFEDLECLACIALNICGLLNSWVCYGRYWSDKGHK